MLELKNISKTYATGDSKVEALKGINLEFRQCEFVSILGPSGCGKTTLLNIIGGLDQYTSGDLFINGISTKFYKDRDWDNYRNHSIGFVFQNYNLIPHQTVLSNVELALTLSGISKEERRRRATEALKKVGLGDQLKKKPAQMSGGQMQRVAIARAIINNPDILLADEPTGALDTETSVQVMEILKEISKDRLVIMVTHNPELAEAYSTRIIKLLDGNLISDSAPYTAEKSEKDTSKQPPKKKNKKNSMSHATAISLSFNNLLTKKGRTFMTSFAGSIGIIGIALILALSSGIQGFIDKVQRETLSTYPLQIQAETVDFTSMITGLQEIANSEEIKEKDPNKIYSSDIMGKFLQTIQKEARANDLGNFKNIIEKNDNGIKDKINAVDYDYNVALNIYSFKDPEKAIRVNPSPIMDLVVQMMTGDSAAASSSMAQQFSSMYNFDMWSQMLAGKDGELIHSIIDDQYELVGDESKWPTKYNEVLLVVDKNNRINDLALYTLNIKDQSVMHERFEQIMKGEAVETDDITDYDLGEIIGMNFYLAPSHIFYEYDEVKKVWIDHSTDGEKGLKEYFDSLEGNNAPIELKITGIIRPREDAVAASITGAIAYTNALAQHVMDLSNQSAVVKEQLEKKDFDILTGLPFSTNTISKDEITSEMILGILSQSPDEMSQNMAVWIQEGMKLGVLSERTVVQMFESMIQTEATYEANLAKLGYIDPNAPQAINIYTASFEDKDALIELIEAHNDKVSSEGKEELAIEYTDLVGLLMSSISTIINIISYVLIGFVSISLVVSSIMIGIITYISVLERTKEIGILRAMGASKKDISRVFKAETGIVGLLSGLVGIGVTVLLTLPINLIVYNLTNDSSTVVSNIASLPVGGAVILVIISVCLTLIGGLIPSKLAAKKDPVEALRTE